MLQSPVDSNFAPEKAIATRNAPREMKGDAGLPATTDALRRDRSARPSRVAEREHSAWRIRF
jgi:hypothetical protein